MAGGVGELDHREQGQHPGPGRDRGDEGGGGVIVKQYTEEA